MPAVTREYRIKIVECRLLEEKLVPQRGSTARVLGWKDFKKLVAPNATHAEIKKLLALRPGYFVGTIRPLRPRRHKTPLTNFVFAPLSGNVCSVRSVVRADPRWEGRLQSVYRVEALDTGAVCADGEGLASRLRKQYPGTLQRVAALREQRDRQMEV